MPFLGHTWILRVYKLYEYGLCKGFHPSPKIAEKNKLQETLQFRYLKILGEKFQPSM